MRQILFALFFFFSPSLFALYSGNPAAPSIIEEGFFFCKSNVVAAKVGYERDWVFDRDMKAVSKVSGRMDDFSYLADQGVLTLNFIDRLEIYGSAGAASFNLSHIPMTGVRNEYETHDQFAWGVGARGIIYPWERVALGADIKYGRSQPVLRYLTTNGVPIKPNSGTKLNFHEWQIGIGVSYQVNIFYPYLTVKYSNATARLKHLPRGFLPGTRHFNMKNRRKFGIALGCSLSNMSRFSLTVEARLIDEQAITLAANLKF